MAQAPAAESSRTEVAAAFAQLQRDVRELTEGFGGDRSEFVRCVIGNVSARGYNVVVVHPPSAGRGYERVFTVTLQFMGRELDYKVYVARKHVKMQVTNAGDGGWINWGLQGSNWVRWGKTVKFHPEWDEQTMGTPYENRLNEKVPQF